MYLQSQASRVRSPSPVYESSTETSSECEREWQRSQCTPHKSTSRKCTPHKCTPHKSPRNPEVTARQVDRKLRDFIQETQDTAEMQCRPAPCATVSVPPKDAVTTFIADIEENIRSKVNATYHDELFHNINTMIYDYKKKPQQQQQLNLQDIQEYPSHLQYHITAQQAGNNVQMIPAAVQPQQPPHQEQALDLEVIPIQQQQIQQLPLQGIPIELPQQGIPIECPLQGIPIELPQQGILQIQQHTGENDIRQVVLDAGILTAAESECMDEDEDQQMKDDPVALDSSQNCINYFNIE